ncbi:MULTISPECIES: aldo/keto reductase [unclassified Herbaspirillum]|nr:MULTISPECIES: aldo/keto reductase [unclassified Herbaspirillum]RFB73790.1 FAD-dependent oxidoreductase [Herbaspirillum sp. 3R-3a1]TFI10399.1 FAD-dependent oxidoreductase [Herbaspirillum sp. 3R11]TFI16304.1 FAD-dependent oxidoreductase [Herbaspirillum sp. 3R-11]
MPILTALPADRIFDLCIVGAGPVGLTLALEAAARGRQVLLLESGGAEHNPATQQWSRATVLDQQAHAPMELASNRALGGSSWLWGGRCVPFEAIDFEPRKYVPHSGWPFTLDEVLPWYDKAADYLDCGKAQFRQAPQHWPEMSEIELSQLERWARQPKLVGKLGPRVLASPDIHILFDATVTGLVFDDDQRSVKSLQARHKNAAIVVQASHFVLAGGGLETTRLLLSAQQGHPALFGGIGGPLGRYYMGHIFGSIASLTLTHPGDFADLDFSEDDTGTYVRRRFTISEEAQRTHHVLNTSFFADNPPFYDERHRNPTLSLVFLGLSFPAIGRRMISEAIRLRHVGPPPYRYGAHLLNVLRRPWQAAADVLTILRLRYVSPVRKPGFVLRNQGGTYALNYHAEQIPNLDSRVTLNTEHDAHGMPRLTVDFRYLKDDAESALKAHEILDRQLRAAGKGKVEYHRSPDQRIGHILEQATDGFHQVGTTRMHDDPQLGVVDRHCQVHGVVNLHIASSSVFPTTGEANPTFLAVALAARLADRLAQRLSAPVADDAATSMGTARTARTPLSFQPGSQRMQTIRIPDTSLDVSRLSFGTASLHHLFKGPQRQALLTAALDAGFTHFDTSPYYGFGLAEKSLGELPTAELQRITIASKVGLYGPNGAGPSVPEILLRKVAGKALPALNKPVVDWSIARAQKSLDDSLRRLRRGWLDVLFLHEPVQALIATEEWQRWLESLVQAGKIRHFGIAGEAPMIAAMLQAAPSLAQIVQVRDSLDKRQADVLAQHQRALQFTYGYMAGGAQPGSDGAAVLRQALQRNPGGSILVSTRRVERVAELARAGS